MIFSERLRELREAKGLSMIALSQKIGVSDAAICKWENATNEPKASYIYLLAEFFEVTTDYLLGLALGECRSHFQLAVLGMKHSGV